MDRRQDKYRLELTNDVQQVPLLNTFVDAMCDEAGTTPALTMQLNLAIEEAVVNVMNYAYPKGTKGGILVTARLSDDTLTFVISDKGIPFNPTLQKPADTTLSAEERRIGGLGIHLVRQLMDTVSYERRDDMNILTLSKFIK